MKARRFTAAAALLVSAGFLGLGITPFQSSAQPVRDRILSKVQLVEEPECALVRIVLNFPIRYVSHFPYDSGDELRIRIQPIEVTRGEGLALGGRESLRAPKSDRAAITEISYEGDDIAGPTVTILFRHSVSFKVAPGSDSRSIIVAVAGRKPSDFCLPVESSF